MQTGKSKEALFNEIKGSLFEFLVCRELAVHYGLENDLLSKLPPHYMQVLEEQDRMVRELYPAYLQALPQLAKASCEALKPHLPTWPVKQVALAGQLVHTNLSKELRETDLFLQGEQERFPISLKLNKDKGLVNTKSGGIKSFFTEYFTSFNPMQEQAAFNQTVDQLFDEMSIKLHAHMGIEWDSQFKHWRLHNLPELPGELPSDAREILHKFYADCAQELRKYLQDFSVRSPEDFAQSLVRVLGAGHENLWQVICFHGASEGDFMPTKVLVHDYQCVVKQAENFQWTEQTQTASCELMLATWQLMIRIKPMNKFTTTAIKINCSVKY